jgi:hypothetical protein
MTTDANRIVIAGVARIHLGPTGTVAPVDAVVTPGTGWREVGLTTQDSLAFTTAPTFGQVRSHQSGFPTRNFQQTDAARVDVDLQEFSGANILAVNGGGVLTQVVAPSVGPPVVAGVWKYSPPAIGGRSNIAALATVTDGAKHYRYVVPLCFQDAGVTEKLTKTAETTLPLRLQVIGSDGVDPYYILTDDPSWSPTAG